MKIRLINANDLMEHVWRDKLDSRELIAQMIDNAPTVKEISTNIPIEIFEKLLKQDIKSKTGHWYILDECSNEGVYCSECHKKVFKYNFSNTMKWKNFKYCPNCGIKMVAP